MLPLPKDLVTPVPPRVFSKAMKFLKILSFSHSIEINQGFYFIEKL